MTTLPAFAKALNEKQFDVLLDLTSWMRSHYNAIEDTHHCEPGYLDLQQDGEDLSESITAAGFTYEQVEDFTFSE